jgi:uncharacterized protein YigE (DUF2233 family)
LFVFRLFWRKSRGRPWRQFSRMDRAIAKMRAGRWWVRWIN